MRVGVILQYRRDDTVQAVMRLTSFIRTLGHTVSVFSRGHTRPIPHFHPEWDRLVVGERDAFFDLWAKEHDVLIWADNPTPAEISFGNKIGARTICIACWDDINRLLGDAFRLADAVVCPSKCQAKSIRSLFSLDNVMSIPWDCGLPSTCRFGEDISGDRTRLLFPLHASQSDRTTAEVAVGMAMRVASQCPWVDISLLVTPKNLPIGAVKNIRRIVSNFPAVTTSILIDNTGFETTPLVYGRHDLVVWPAEIEGFGMVGLESLCMGTPVICYDASPMHDIVTDGQNGRTVTCDVSFSSLRTPFVVPDWDLFEETIVNLLNERTGLAELRRNTRLNFESRRAAFSVSWHRLLLETGRS